MKILDKVFLYIKIHFDTSYEKVHEMMNKNKKSDDMAIGQIYPWVDDVVEGYFHGTSKIITYSLAAPFSWLAHTR